jgi:hypothetical protein
MLVSELAKKLGEIVVRPQLDALRTKVPLDHRPDIGNELRRDVIRWFWHGRLYVDDRLSVRVSLGCRAEAVMRAKVRAYYRKAFASVARRAPGGRDRQEIYTGRTHKFMVTDDSEATFGSWLVDELRGCTLALQRST